MSDNNRANAAYKEGMTAWEMGKYEDAVSLFREALSLAEPGYFLIDQFYGALGQVLSLMGDVDGARNALESALSEVISQNKEQASPSVVMARYFLAEYLLEIDEPSHVLPVINPSIGIGAKQEGLLQYVRALTLVRLGRMEESKTAAKLALELARSEKQRNNFREQLKNIIDL